MTNVRVHNQRELDAAIAAYREGDRIICYGPARYDVSGSATVEARDSATIRAWDYATVRASGSATVEAWGFATVEASDSVTVRAWDSATVRASDSATVRASDSATVEASYSATVEASYSATVEAWASVTVRAWDSATVRAWDSVTVRAWDSVTVRASDSATIRASGSATVEAWGFATVEASRYVAVHKMDTTVTVSGGVVIEPPSIDSAQAWLDYHGVEARDGVVILHKAVTDNWHASRALPDGTLPSYAPGEQPSAPDFDPSMRDCGGGLHACARPAAALRYHNGPKLVAIPVRVTDLGCPDPHGDTGKIRFRCAAEPIYEVDIDGRAI